MAIRGRALSILVHSGTKVGKSTFANTAPAPRLLIDAEAAHRFLPGRKIFWEPQRDWPPGYDPQTQQVTYDGTWDTCVVIVREYADMQRAYEWLKSGLHPFESVVLDSITEIQTKCKQQLTESGDMDQKRWGKLLDHMSDLVRGLRDMTEHPTRPLTAIVVTAMTSMKNDKWRAYVEGALSTKLPYFIDIVGYMFTQDIPSHDPSQLPTKVRRLLTRDNPQFEAGERVQGRLPEFIDGDYINVEWMLDQVFGPIPTPQEAQPVAAATQ